MPSKYKQTSNNQLQITTNPCPTKPTKNLQNQRHGKESITNRMGQHKHAIHSTSTLTTGTEENVIQKQKSPCLNKHHPRK